ncbi:MAG: phage holin family protein [Povalibacter sp.]|jgi:Flp pilus assembly protein TadB
MNSPMSSMNSNSNGTSASTTALLGRLFDDATALLRNEVQLAKAEFLNAANEVKTRAVSMAAGGALLAVAALVFVTAAILALAEVVAPWLAALIVGVVLAIIGAILLSAARKRLSSGNLERTKASLERDANVVARRT